MNTKYKIIVYEDNLLHILFETVEMGVYETTTALEKIKNKFHEDHYFIKVYKVKLKYKNINFKKFGVK